MNLHEAPVGRLLVNLRHLYTIDSLVDRVETRHVRKVC